MKYLFKLAILGFAGVFLTIASSTETQAAAYVKIGDIKGESMATTGGHKDWIIIESMQFSNGVLMIKHKNGKKERLRNGTYQFKNGETYVVKNGKAQKISARGKRSIIRTKTKTTNKPGIEHEDIGRKPPKKKGDN